MNEVDIAKENMESHKEASADNDLLRWGYCSEHMRACERDVLRLEKIKESIVYVENELAHHLLNELLEDKKQALKLYEEAGVK